MFTGIIEELGTVASREGSRLRINARTVLEGSGMGASIAVNGCCLTLVKLSRRASHARLRIRSIHDSAEASDSRSPA